jgi:hypothetical protein
MRGFPPFPQKKAERMGHGGKRLKKTGLQKAGTITCTEEKLMNL